MISTQETTLPEHASGVGCHRGGSPLCKAALRLAGDPGDPNPGGNGRATTDSRGKSASGAWAARLFKV
jgi:hypothetical protein